MIINNAPSEPDGETRGSVLHEELFLYADVRGLNVVCRYAGSHPGTHAQLRGRTAREKKEEKSRGGREEAAGRHSQNEEKSRRVVHQSPAIFQVKK